MGASDFISGNFKNNTRPILKKLETSSETVELLIESLIDSKILKVRVTFTGTGDTWDPVYEPLVVFLSDRTHWEFWTEGFNDYLIRTEGNNDDQSSVLFEQRESLTPSEKKTIKE
jgi:hypothetical protein